MKHRSVGNVMTEDVVSVRVRTPFRSIAELLSTHHISAVPVLGATDTVLGVVSEVDLLRKYELSVAVDRPPWWARTRRRMWLKTTGTVAEDVMTAPAITVDVDANIGVAARLLTDHNVKRLPVVDASDHLVGIVSRHDLVQVFVRSDDDIHAEIGEEVLVRALSVDPRTVSIEVRDGAVTLRGQLERRSMVPMAIHLTRSVDGVVAVTDQLTFTMDDTHVSDGTQPQNLGILHHMRPEH
jgi:CBS-domain-containing membrane protein